MTIFKCELLKYSLKTIHRGMMVRFIVSFTTLILCIPLMVQAQLEMSSRYIRVAETGELADSVNVWGDVTNSGRYIVPTGTNLPDLISFAFGYTDLQTRGRENNWSKTRIRVKISRYNEAKSLVDIKLFEYKFKEPLPVGMYEFDLQNNDIVTVQVKRIPTFADYVDVIAPVIGVVATSLLLIENLSN